MSGALPAPTPGPMPTDPMAGAADDAGGDDNVVVTICKNGDGSYTVYAGDEPEGGDSDMSGEDADAMGPGGAAPAVQGQPADSVGAALKIAMDLLKSDASGGSAPGNADDQFAAGFGATPPSAPVAQKY